MPNPSPTAQQIAEQICDLVVDEEGHHLTDSVPSLVALIARALTDARREAELREKELDVHTSRHYGVGYIDGVAAGKAEAERERDGWREEARQFCQNADFWRAKSEAAEQEIARLKTALQEIADYKLCAEEPDECYLDSGPYCGAHDYSVERAVGIARTALRQRPEEPK